MRACQESCHHNNPCEINVTAFAYLAILFFEIEAVYLPQRIMYSYMVFKL